jgi:hypothetical protein
MSVSRGLNLGSHRTYDEIWYAYFADQTSPDYVFPMVLFDVTEEAASIFNFANFGGAPDLMAPLPFFNSGIDSNEFVDTLNNRLSLYRWLCLTSGVTDITLKSSQRPIYFSLYIAIRDSDSSFCIRSPEQIISHHAIWLGDTLEVEELKKMPGASFMIYEDNGQTRINVSIHQGSWIQKYIKYLIDRLSNSVTPSNVIEEIIDTYYVYYLQPTLDKNATPNHTFLNPFYLGIIMHYVNNWEDDMLSITDVSNNNLFVSLNGVRYPVIRLTSDFIKYSVLHVIPCDVPLGGSWPSPNRGIRNGETLTIYNYYNWPHSVHYSTEKDISGLPDILYGVTNSYEKEKSLLTVTFHTDNIYIPVPNSSDSIKTSILKPPQPSPPSPPSVPAVSVNYLLDSVSSYTRQKLHRCYPNAPIHIFYIDEDSKYAGHMNYGYYIFDLSSTYYNWSDFRVSSFIWVANSDDVSEGYYGSFHFISFYTGYPFVIDARVKSSGYSNHPVRVPLTEDKDKIGFYYNPLYPLAKTTTVGVVGSGGSEII